MSSSASPGDAAAAAERGIEESTTSALRTQEQVNLFCSRYSIVLSEGFTVSPAEADRNLSSPPPARAVCVHLFALESGFCCDPRQDFFNKVLSHFGIAPSQLGPNAWRTMACFVGLCHSLGVEPSVAVFRRFYTLFSMSSYFFFPQEYQQHVYALFFPLGATIINNQLALEEGLFLGMVAGAVGLPRCGANRLRALLLSQILRTSPRVKGLRSESCLRLSIITAAISIFTFISIFLVVMHLILF
jgi:hypothetical protein